MNYHMNSIYSLSELAIL